MDGGVYLYNYANSNKLLEYNRISIKKNTQNGSTKFIFPCFSSEYNTVMFHRNILLISIINVTIFIYAL